MIGFSSPALPQILMPGQPMHNNENAASWFGSIVTIGAMVGCPFGGWLLDKFGRKQTLLLCALPFLAGWFAVFIGANLEVLFIGRLLTGIGSGMACVAAPLYISETSTKELRGMLGSGVQLSVTIGIVIVYVLGMVSCFNYLCMSQYVYVCTWFLYSTY